MADFTILFQEESTVLALHPLQHGMIGIVTEASGVYQFDPASGSVSKHLRIGEFDHEEHNCAFSPDGALFAFAHTTSKGYAIRIIDTGTKTLLRSYGTQDNPVELLAFDATGTYLVAGTTTGRVFLWRTDGNNLLARLSSFPEYTPHLLTLPKENYVSAACFHGALLATTGYGGSIVITNIQTLANTKRIKPGKARINALIFRDERHLIAGNEEGVVMSIPVDDNHTIRRVSTGIGPIRHLILLPESGFLLAASAYNHIALVHLDTLELLDARYLTTPSAVKAIVSSGAFRMLIAMENGDVSETELPPFRQFDELMEHGRYADAYTLCDKIPFMKLSGRYRELEAAFDAVYSKAQHFLGENRRDDAVQILMPFMKTASKTKPIRALLSAFDNAPRFVHLVGEQRYSIAYGLLAQYPMLRYTAACEALEHEWQQAYLKAQKLVLQGHDKQARQVFGNFMTVAEKSPYIRLLLQNKALLVAFAKALTAKDFVTLKKLTEREPILKETPSYHAAMESAATIIESIMEAIKTEAYDKAELLCAELLQIPHLAQHHANISRFISRARTLSAAYADADFTACYELLDRATELGVLPLAKTLETEWNERMEACEAAALAGNTAAIKERLGPLVALASRSEKVGNLLRISYQMQIKYLISKERMQYAGSSIERYIDLFGIDNEVRQLIRLLSLKDEELYLNEAQMQNRPRNLWLSKTQGIVPDRLIEPKRPE